MISAMLFDVFGTVVDWRTSVARELAQAFPDEDRDWDALADAWRAQYDPAMAPIRDGRRRYTDLDVLHRENLDALIAAQGLPDLAEDARRALAFAWHRLDPWPDSVVGLQRLRAIAPCATCSNGNIALMVNLARHGGLVWDAILGAAIAQSYKSDPKVYLKTAEALGLEPASCMMVAAHNADLHAARALGFQTAFILRPTEHGPGQTKDLEPEDDWDHSVSSLIELAEALG